MTYADRLARLLYAACWVAIAGATVWLVHDVATGHLPFRNEIDPRTGTAGLSVETDAGTGCQYIVTPWGGIVARTGPDGRQVCEPRQP